MSNDHADLLTTVARLRRAQPRNVDTVAVCDALERFLVSGGGGGPAKRKRAPGGTFDRRVYQREYMRKRRAASG